MGPPVVIVDYDPSWPARFEEERALIEGAIGPWIFGGVHHVGSTAVPGLAAKPVIDIMVGVEDREAARATFDTLAALSYCYFPYKPDEMHWFCKPSDEVRTHHLHMVEPTHPQWRARLAFRDFLRAHPETAGQYAELKRRLARDHHADREAYTEAKGEFVGRVLARAGVAVTG